MSQPFGQSLADPGNMTRNVTVDLNADVSGFTQGMQQATAQAQALAGALSGAVEKADSLAKRAGKTLMHFSAGDFAGLSAGVGVAARFESQLGTLNATATITGTNMNQLKAGLTGVFNQFPVWREQVVQLATAISNMGVVRAPDVTRLTGSYTKLGAATGEDSTSLASSGITLAKQMGNLDASKIEKFNNELLVLSKTAGVSAQSITDFASSIAPFTRQAGIAESQTMALSAAFQKAGADGQVAANAFSSLLSTIQQLKTSGGDVSKYSGFLGVSQQQFKQMSTQQAAGQIFQQIAKGGARADVFTQDLGGTRVQGAIQKLAQSGGINQLSGVGTAAYQGGDQLDVASKAAMSGFTDSLTSVRNNFTELAQIIGDPLLKPLTTLVDLFGKAVGALGSFLKMLGPVPGVAAAAVGVAAVPAAFGLAHAGLAATLGTAKYALGPRAAWRQAIGAGQRVSAAVAGGADEADALMADPYGRRFVGGSLSGHTAAAFDLGRRNPNLLAGGGGGVGGFGGVLSRLFGGGVGGAWGSGWQQGQTGQPAAAAAPAAATTPGGAAAKATAGFQMPKISVSGIGGKIGDVANWVLDANQIPMRERNTEGLDRTGERKAAGEDVSGGKSGWKRFRGGAARGAYEMADTLTGTVGDVAGWGASKLPATPGGLAGKGVLRGVQGVAQGASWLSRGIGAGMGLLAENPLIGVGVMAAGAGISYIASQNQKRRESMQMDAGTMGSMSAVGKYDVALDQTSSNLGKLGDAASTAADNLNHVGESLPSALLPHAGDVGDVSKSAFKITDSALSTIVKKSGSDAEIQKNVGSYLQALGINNPAMSSDQATQVRKDVLSAVGTDKQPLVKSILETFSKQMAAPGTIGAGADFSKLGRVAGAPGVSMDDWRSLVSTGVQSVAAGTQGSPTGALPGLADTVRILGAATAGRGGNQGDRVTAAFNTLQTQYGIDPKEAEAAMRAYTEKKGQAELVLPDKPYDTSTSLRAGTLGGLPGQQNVAGQVYSPFDTEAQANAAFAAAITGSKSGQKYLAAQGIQGTAFQQGVTTGMPMPPAGATTQEDLANLARTGGRLGQRLAGLSTIGAAATATGQPGTQQAAVSTMLNAAMTQAGPGPNQAAQAQALILASTKDVSGALKDVAANAADAAGQLAQIAQVNFSPLQNAINTITTAQATIAAGTAPHASDAEAALVPAARTQLAGGEADLTQQAHQKIQAVKDFNTQQARAQADYNQQVGWANDAFNTQQARSALAYGTSVARSKRDFATQEQRGDYQNNLRISRSTRDFQTGQERNTQQYNLSRTREVRDFDKQQARAAEDYNTSRTRQVRDYNTQTARAQRDFHKDQTRQLQEFNINRGREETQYQLDRSRSIQDFNTQQAQAAEDFHTSQTRELKHFNTQQARAERDYFKQRNRAQQDFDTQMVRNAEKTAQNIYDPWSRIQRKQTASATNLLHNLTNQNQAIQKQIAEIKEAKELGVSEQTIQELDLSNPANAQELDKLIKSMKSNPQMVSSINQQVSKRVAGTKSLTQTADSLDYKNTMEDFLKEQQRGWADYQQSVKDATADLATSMSEQYADFVKTTDRAQKEQAKNLARSEHDHEVAMSQEMTDFKRTTSQASADFATSLHDQWTDLQTSLTDGEADFKKSSIRAKDDLATSLHDQAVDFTTQMANSLHDFKISMADAQSDFLTARANARHDQQVTLSDMKTDYTIASGQAVHDHGVAMSQMETQYNTTLTRAGDDLKTSFQSVTGNLNTSLITMADQAKGQLAEYGPQAVQDYINWINTAANAVGNAAATVPQPAAGGVNYGQPGSATAHDQDPAHYASGQSGGTTGHGVGHAAGGITMAQHLAMVGEAGRELILPLNTHGEKFMGGLMKNAMNLVGGQFGEGRSELDKQEAQKRYEAAQKAEAARRQKQAEDEARRKAIADAAIAKANAEAAKKKAAEEARRKADEAEAKKRHDQEVANANAKKKADAAKAAAGHPVSHPAAHPAAAKPAAHPAAHPAAAAAAADPYTKALEAGFKNITHQLAVGQGNLANVITKALAAVIVPALKAEEAALNRIVTNDNTVSFSGAQIKVIAQDEKAMAKKLLAAAKLKRLTSPVKH